MKTKIDGQYIEDLIAEFRTLGVEGREELDLEVTSSEIATSDGGRYKRRRIKSRVLKVHFYLSDDTASGFSAKFKALKAKLYGIKESQIIFSDDANVYFTGTFRKLTFAYKGNTVTRGTCEIFCADPFKYSLTEYTATAANGVITVDYGGTYPAHPILTAQSEARDCGFYSFEDQDGHIIQVGNPAEEDQEEVPTDTAVTIVNTHFGRLYDGITGWHAADAVLLYGYNKNGDAEVGNDYAYTEQYAPVYTYYYGAAGGHNFEDPYPNFELSFVNWFEPSGNQGGGFDFYVNNSGGGNVCGVSVWKNKNGRVQWSMIVKGNIVKSGSYSLADNPFKGAWRTQTITKIQGTVTFNFGGVSFTVNDSDLAGHAYDAKNASFIFYRQPEGDDIKANNALQSVLIRGIPNTWQEIANKIPQNGLIEVDAGSGEISLNGASRPDLGSVNNDFEDFKLETGINTVSCNASDWVDDAVYTMKYREVFM